MKKSEMIEILRELIGKNHSIDEKDNQFQVSTLCFRRGQLDKILEGIEEAGMYPPSRKATPEDFSNIGFDQEFLDDHDFCVNGWEPEDD